MSFTGKKYRRVRCENIEELLKAAKGIRKTVPKPESKEPASTSQSNSNDSGCKASFCKNWKMDPSKGPNENLIRMLQHSAPIFSFTRVDDTTLQLTVQMDEIVRSHTFKLDEQQEWARRDGCQIKVKFTLESENVLKQEIHQADGTVAYFIREFSDRETKMTIKLEGVDAEAVIYYEIVE
ncbi:uncharacterized protein LOC131846339 [Achroia grisella]|uniref:uncharacterized protein LOC131846339 n=1 Tax=Achroia grisella TaxID=688607 RepID=UPI0027D2834D|nr:uncharacterized protein LOC131846339 [Achroia grisella]